MTEFPSPQGAALHRSACLLRTTPRKCSRNRAQSCVESWKEAHLHTRDSDEGNAGGNSLQERTRTVLPPRNDCGLILTHENLF